MQVLLMDAPKYPQVGAQPCTCSFAGVAVDFAFAISIVSTRPLTGAVAHGRVLGMAAVIALPFIRVQDRVLLGDILGDQVSASVPVRTVAHPEPLLPRLARDDADDGRPIIGIGAVPPPFIGAADRRGRDGAYFFSPAFW